MPAVAGDDAKAEGVLGSAAAVYTAATETLLNVPGDQTIEIGDGDRARMTEKCRQEDIGLDRVGVGAVELVLDGVDIDGVKDLGTGGRGLANEE